MYGAVAPVFIPPLHAARRLPYNGPYRRRRRWRRSRGGGGATARYGVVAPVGRASAIQRPLPASSSLASSWGETGAMYGVVAPVIAPATLAAYREPQVKAGPWRGGLPMLGVAVWLMRYALRAWRDVFSGAHVDSWPTERGGRLPPFSAGGPQRKATCFRGRRRIKVSSLVLATEDLPRRGTTVGALRVVVHPTPNTKQRTHCVAGGVRP